VGQDLLRQCARRAEARGGDGARPRSGGRRRGERVTPVVPVYHPRREARRAVKQGYPRRLGTVRLCRSGEGVERLLQRHLVDAVVLDVKAAPDLAQALPVRFPRIPMFALSAFRPDDGELLRRCQGAGYAGVLGEGVDYAVRGVVRILGYASPSHLAAAARRVAGVVPQELRALGPGGVLARFIKGRTRSRT